MVASPLTLCLVLVLFVSVTQSQSCSHGDVRLADGDSQLEGRVEVCFLGNWGTVCDDLWDTVDAGVVCRQLGYSDQGATATDRSFFGQGTGIIYVDDIQCNGEENNLLECPRAADYDDDCSHSEDAGVVCQIAGVALMRDGDFILNNSLISLDSLGSFSGSANTPLLCVTSFVSGPECSGNCTGNWFPSRGNAPLGKLANSTDLYQSIVDSKSVGLNRPSEVASVESGLYRCEIPDDDGVTQTLYVGVYSTDNDGNVSISGIAYEKTSQSVICTSTGGPATSVSWSRDNTSLVVDGTTYQQLQVVMDTSTATYENRLSIVSKSASLSGVYMCSVGNSRGDTTSSLELTVCRDDETRALRETDSSPVVVEICEDDQWLTLNLSMPNTRPLTGELPPANLQLSSVPDGLLLSWEAPLTNEVVTGYDITCSTPVQPSNGQKTTLSLPIDTRTTTSARVIITTLQQMTYTCCITPRYENTAQVSACDNVLFLPTQESQSNLVSVLGVLVGLFFLVAALMGVVLVVLMVASAMNRKVAAGNRVRLVDMVLEKEPENHTEEHMVDNHVYGQTTVTPQDNVSDNDTGEEREVRNSLYSDPEETTPMSHNVAYKALEMEEQEVEATDKDNAYEMIGKATGTGTYEDIDWSGNQLPGLRGAKPEATVATPPQPDEAGKDLACHYDVPKSLHANDGELYENMENS